MGLIKERKVIILGIAAAILFISIGRFLKSLEDKQLEDMQVEVLANVPEDDFFQFFYWEKSEEKFQIKNSHRVKVVGSKDDQIIKFQLPTLSDLHKIRLDIGENYDQGEVVIKEIRFIKENNEIIVDTEAFNRLFAPNKYVEVKGRNSFSGIPGKRGTKPFYDPFFVSKDDSQEMELIRTNKFTEHPYLISGFLGLVFFLFGFYNRERISIKLEHVFVFVFLAILLLPTIQEEIEFATPLENIEKRKLAEKPAFKLTKGFTDDFQAYHSDNFGLRNYLVNWGVTFRTKLFRSSVHPDLVKFGKNNWLFFNDMDGSIFRSYSRTDLFSAAETDKIVKSWQTRKERYEADGRKFFVTFWPDKPSIYPEYLPHTMKIQIEDTLSRIDQLIRRTNSKDITVKLTDIRPRLLEGKENDSLRYRKFDTHWNAYGAFLAYQEFFRQNKGLGMAPKALNDFNVEWQDNGFGDLILMLGFRNKGHFIEKKPIFTIKQNKDQIQYLPTKGFPKRTVITRNEHSGNKLRALIYRDSFTNDLVQFFSLHFYEVYYIWNYNEEFVEKLDPDVVIEGFVERRW